MIPRPKYIANKMPRHVIFLLLIIYINVICIHQIYADGISMTSRNIHMNSIVENKNDFNRLKAEEINTKAMEIEATSVKDALQLLLEAYKLDPTNWMINANLANVYSNFEQRYSLELSSEKRIEYRKQIFFFSDNALKLNPDHPGLLNNHGILLKEYNERHKAIEVLKKTIQLDPTIYEAHSGLSDIYLEIGETEKAVNQYHIAMKILKNQNIDSIKFKVADAMIPRIYLSYRQMHEIRIKYDKYVLTELSRINDCTKLLDTLGDGAFGYYLIYQGGNDLIERLALARAYRHCAPKLLDDEEKKTRKNMTNHVYQMQGNLSSQQERRRIGFISSFFRKHSVGKLIKGIITELCKQTTYRNKYEVYVYFIGGINLNDNITKEILSSMNHANIRKFSSHETLNSVANSILDDLLDVLIYPEIGMDHLTYFLAYKRLARVQASFWGHPVSSGIEYTMDYFISSNLFHIYDKEYEQNKFIEQLYYMNGLTTYFQKPEEVSIDKLFITNVVAKTFKAKRFRYNIDNDNFVDNQYHLYICLQTLYKLTPHFDKVIKGILEKDEKAIIIMLKNPNEYYAKRMMKRLENYIDNHNQLKRVLFFDLLTKTDFLKLSSLAHVALDRK